MSDFANQRATQLVELLHFGSQDCLFDVFTLRGFNYEIQFTIRWKYRKKGGYTWRGSGRVSFAPLSSRPYEKEKGAEHVSTAKRVIDCHTEFGGMPWVIL